MVSKAVRRRDLLNTVRNDREIATGVERHLYKHELETIHQELVPDRDTPNNRAGILQSLRAHTSLDTDRGEKELTKYEIRQLGREIENGRRLGADAVLSILEQAATAGADRLVVNGDPYACHGIEMIQGCSAPGYEGYRVAHLEDDHRVVGFIDWDPDNCYYDIGAALEHRTGHDPYYKWKRDAYITSLDWQ